MSGYLMKEPDFGVYETFFDTIRVKTRIKQLLSKIKTNRDE